MQNQKTVFSECSAAAGIETDGNKQETAMMAGIRKLSNRELLCQTKLLAQKERSLHIQVLRHLREIESRRLYFSEGYASLFDYAVRGLGYSKGAAFRRINAMRLCRAEPEVEAKLKSGRLSLCAASQLQNFFEKKKREESRIKKEKASGAALVSQLTGQQRTLESGNTPALQEKGRTSLPGQRANSVPAPGQDGNSGQKQSTVERERSVPRERVSSASEPSCSSAKEPINREQMQRREQALERRQKLELIEKAEGRSSRETERLLLEQSPDSKRILRKDQIRFLGEGVFEIKTVIDAVNHRKLEKLKFLLSHQNPSMGYGDLLGILLDLGLQKYDPSLRAQKPFQNRKEAKTKAAAVAESGEGPREHKIPVPGRETSRGSAPGQRAGSGSAPGREASRGSAPGQRESCGSALGQRESGGSTPGREASRGSAPGQRAGSGSAPGQGASKGLAPGREASHGSAPGQAAGRYIPAEVRRLVWARDRGRCSYVNPKTGQKCGSRYMIQMDHIKPYALGGLSTKENMRLLCAGHNRFRARQTFPSSARSRLAPESASRSL